MRRLRFLAIAVMAIALVFASTTAVFAMPHGDSHKSPYHVSKPQVATHKVAIGVSFEASGVVLPAIAVDDLATTVAVEVYSVPKHGRPVLVATAPAALSAGIETGTVYVASIILPGAGEFRLVAAVSKDGSVIARSKARIVHAIPPYKVSKPKVASHKVAMGFSFETSGVVLPAIAVDDLATTVAVEVYSVPKHGRPVLVATVPAALSAGVEAETVYAAMVTLPEAGEYRLVAVVSRDGAVLARSKAREMHALLPYKVSKPRIASCEVETGVSFEASGVVLPAIATDDAVTKVSVLVFEVGRRHKLTQVASFDAVLTGPVGEGTGYSAAVTLPTDGKFVLVAVVTRDSVVLGRSGQRCVKSFTPLPVVPASPAESDRHHR
jgi:hypothetical protein